MIADRVEDISATARTARNSDSWRSVGVEGVSIGVHLRRPVDGKQQGFCRVIGNLVIH